MTPKRIAATCVTLLAARVVAGAQAPMFSVRVEGVPVDVLVTRGGRPVRGLTTTDFEVRDNGVLQQVDLVSFEQLPLNVVLALDLSQSVTGERLTHLRTAGQALVDKLVTDDRVALLTFSHRVMQRAPLGGHFEAVRAALDAAEPGGDTALVDAAYAAIALGDTDAGRTLVMIFSDGLDSSSWLTPARVIDTARQSDAVVYAVWTGLGGQPSFLRERAESSGGRVLDAESTARLPDMFVSILNEFRHRYLVTYTPRGVAAGGWHRLDVRVRQGGVTVRSRPGYVAAGR